MVYMDVRVLGSTQNHQGKVQVEGQNFDREPRIIYPRIPILSDKFIPGIQISQINYPGVLGIL